MRRIAKAYGVPLAGGVLAALALALAACSGSAATPEAASTPALTAVATPEATSTPAPTAIATPEAASTSEASTTPAPTATPAETGAGGAPVPGAASLAACSNGIAIIDPDAHEGLVRDCALLLDGKDALRGTTPLDWSASVPMTEWEGVDIRIPGRVGGARGSGPPRVTRVYLRNKGLTGVIPPQLGYLTELTSLDLAGNGLTGAIPPELANLAALEQFLAGGNRLTGAIPAGFGLLHELHTLDLSDNRLAGTIPDLSRLTRLRRLDLRGNGLVGGIPAWLGDMRALAVLRLDGNRLSGPVPRGIGRLPLLREAFLAGRNALTGCVPSRFEDIESDADGLGLPWCLRYDALDVTGEVASAGEWAILGGNGKVLATWEQLRSEAATLRVHQTDAGGTSWAPEFGAVAVNDLFEWRIADDCWLRYRVTGAPAPPSGASGRWDFPVERYAHAATGAGCKGAVGTSTVLSVDEAAPTTVRLMEIASPVRQGPFLIAPRGWTGEIERGKQYLPPAAEAGARGAGATADPIVAETAADARRLFRHWRDPALPADWTFWTAIQDPGDTTGPSDRYCARYRNAEGHAAVEICVDHMHVRPYYERVWWRELNAKTFDLRTIDGHPAHVTYGHPHSEGASAVCTRVGVFDRRSELLYVVEAYDGRLCTNVDAVMAIARSLLPPADAP